MLFSGNRDLASHAVRLVLAEKAVGVDILMVDDHNDLLTSDDFLEVNPKGTLPTLVDRDLILTEPAVIMEYLDERFPHPPLLPVYPVARAKSRAAIVQLKKDWYPYFDALDAEQVHDPALIDKMQKQLLVWEPLFEEAKYFLSDEFSLVDCYMAPMMWRLPYFGVEISKEATGLRHYLDRLFEMRSFRASLSDFELEIGEDYGL